MKWWAWSIPAVLAVLVYLPVWNAGFVWDDQFVQQFMLRQESFKTHESYRLNRFLPVYALSFRLDDAISTAALGKDVALMDPARARVPHLTNVLIHALATLCVALLAGQILRGQEGRAWGALAAGLIFAAHPIHTESVAWITGRVDSLATLFMLPAVMLALAFRDRGGPIRLLVSAALFLLAILSKETALAMVLLLPFLYWLVPGEAFNKRRAGMVALSVLLAIGLYIALRAGLGADVGAVESGGPGEAAGRVLAAASYYLVKIIYPWPQLHYVVELPGVGVTAAVLVCGALFLAGGIRAARRDKPVLLISVIWFIATLAPSLLIALITTSKNPVAERYLYLPSVALSLCVGGFMAAAARSKSRHGPALAVVILIAAVFAAGTLRRNRVWRDSESLWSNALTHPSVALNAAGPHNSLGSALLKQGRTDEAAVHFRAALTIDPDHVPSNFNLGIVLVREGRPEEAIERFRRALKAEPDSARIHAALGDALLKGRRYDEAIAAYERVLQVDPNNVGILLNLGSALDGAGRLDEAIARTGRALEIEPDSADVHFNSGTMLLKKGRRSDSMIHFRRAVEINPNHARARAQLRALGQ